MSKQETLMKFVLVTLFAANIGASLSHLLAGEHIDSAIFFGGISGICLYLNLKT